MLAQPARAPGLLHEERPSLHEVTLTYPESWVVRLAPHAAAMERRTLAWLRQRGIVHDRETSERFQRLSVGEYANWPFAMATAGRAEVITKFLALRIFYDDAVQDAEAGRASAIHEAIRAASPIATAGDRHLACWWELGQQYGRTMSRAWLDRHALRFSEWVGSIARDRANAVRFRASGKHPSVARHLAARRLDVGMLPAMSFLEYQMGWELPDEVLDDPSMRDVERSAADAVVIVNDVFGFSNDRENRSGNAVACLAAEADTTLERAFELACAIHAERVALLVQLEQELVAKYPRRRELSDWFAGLHCLLYGFAQWYSRAPRYRARHLIADREIRVRVRPLR